MFSDVTLSVEGRDFEVHSFLLKIRSSYFEALFAKRWSQNDTSDSKKTIKISSPITATAMDSVLSHIYEGKENLDLENISEVWVAASYFQVNSLKMKCIEYMTQTLCISTCLYFLETIQYAENQDVTITVLEKNMTDFLRDNASDIFAEKDHYIHLSPKIFSTVLSDNHIRCDEFLLLEALLNFLDKNVDPTQDEQTQREFLLQHDLLWCIQYIHIDSDEILELKFLTAEEKVSILRRKSGKVDTSLPVDFQPTPRAPPMLNIERLRMTSGVWPSDGTKSDVIGVKFSKSVTLIGLSPCDILVDAQVDIDLRLFHAFDTIGAQYFTKFNCKANSSINLMLEKAIKLQQGEWYTIEVCIKSPVWLQPGHGGIAKHILNSQWPQNPPLQIEWANAVIPNVINTQTSILGGMIKTLFISGFV